CDTLRWVSGCPGAPGVPAALTGGRNFAPRPFFFPFRLTGYESKRCRVRTTVPAIEQAGGGGACSRTWSATVGGDPPACRWAAGHNRVRRWLRYFVSRAQLYRRM